MSSIAIIIPTHNRPQLVERLLNSLTRYYASAKVNIVVVDDFSSEVNRKHLVNLSKSFPEVNFIYSDYPLGAAKARNTGYGALNEKPEWVWFVDDDDEVPLNSIKVLDEYIMLPNNSPTDDILLFCAKYLTDRGEFEIIPEGDGLFKRARSNGHDVNTSCTIFRSHLFELVGGWDDELLSGQDTDIILRAAKFSDAYVFSGYSILIDARSEDRITGNPKKQLIGKFQFLKKNWSLLSCKRRMRYLLTMLFLTPYLRRVLKR
ncbi:glycosyltransferase family 2 protein [Aliidiomarina sp. Khilg15.8]